MPAIRQAPSGTLRIPSSQLDTRSDEDIIALLTAPTKPDGDEKNLWAYWHTGFNAMPPWSKRNVVHWARLLGPSWNVRVLDGVPGSPSNASCFVPPEMLPEAMRKGSMSGPYVATHSADFVRLPLLYLYGGCWLDVGAILVRSIDDIWSLLVDPETPYEFAAFTYETRPGEMSIINTWMMARKDCDLIRRWHETFLYIWGNATSCEGLSRHPLLRHLKPYGAPTDKIIMNEKHEEVTKSRAIMDYGAQVHCLERLRDLVDKEDGWNGRDWIERKAFLLPALKEMWYYQERTGFMGYKQFELLTTRYDAPEEQRKDAETFVNDMLANTLLMKFCHGLKNAMASSLADIWDDPQHHDTDCAPETFAEYLRWGTINLRQTRQLVPEKLTPAEGEPHRVGMFEPFYSAEA
ncbi:capsule polysaccharide biosynthesis protein [Colletotrichum higginsianum]|uniref:Capsule polysaccharide biosynthesis protein n=1 Tax=Colletotrichum higginsianum (strain IMI 349063) TaxID=759273 RepID=H1V7R0_COLHI|nr:Capsule polysaccharide biosynthesis protein [Colletotrichum higginsianum IMI 349063]OBR04592.1 Capsule polysaccharide biosynthesis protein [Colletotrichum higginsianum IMI 349063]CCF36262.1 capsule polysaccharide biosynthesis protein [Colletotrichum higginsianum]